MIRQAALVALLALAAPFACAPEFDETRDTPPPGSTGQELYGVICDRVGANALTEDLRAASYHAVCHPNSSGVFADAVDTTQLPVPSQTTTASGATVTLAAAEATRAYAVGRVNALAKDRTQLIAAFDATLPDVRVPTNDITNPDPTTTGPCRSRPRRSPG
jgi:hypothetical protein